MMPTPGLPVGRHIIAGLSRGELIGAVGWSKVFEDFPWRRVRRGLPPVMNSASRLMGCDVGEPLWPHAPLDAVELGQLRGFLNSFDLIDGLKVPVPVGPLCKRAKGRE